MPWGAVIGAVGTYLGGRSANKGAERGARAQEEANRLAIEEQRRQYDQTREDYTPFREAGYDALGRQRSILDGDTSGFENSADYKWRLGEGMRSLDRSAAARGSLFSGGTDLDRMRFGQGLAQQGLDSHWAKLAGIAGQGYNATTNLGQFGQQSANNIGSLLNNSGQARNSSYQAIGNNNSQMWGVLAGGINQFGQGRGWWGG